MDNTESLERMVDATSLTTVVSQLSEICFDKADHISSNWQDEGLASIWQDLAESLAEVSTLAKSKCV